MPMALRVCGQFHGDFSASTQAFLCYGGPRTFLPFFQPRGWSWNAVVVMYCSSWCQTSELLPEPTGFSWNFWNLRTPKPYSLLPQWYHNCTLCKSWQHSGGTVREKEGERACRGVQDQGLGNSIEMLRGRKLHQALQYTCKKGLDPEIKIYVVGTLEIQAVIGRDMRTLSLVRRLS